MRLVWSHWTRLLPITKLRAGRDFGKNNSSILPQDGKTTPTHPPHPGELVPWNQSPEKHRSPERTAQKSSRWQMALSSQTLGKVLGARSLPSRSVRFSELWLKSVMPSKEEQAGLGGCMLLCNKKFLPGFQACCLSGQVRLRPPELGPLIKNL